MKDPRISEIYFPGIKDSQKNYKDHYFVYLKMFRNGCAVDGTASNTNPISSLVNQVLATWKPNINSIMNNDKIMEQTWNDHQAIYRFNNDNDRDKFMIEYTNDFCRAAREGNMVSVNKLLETMDSVMQLEFGSSNIRWTMPIPQGVLENGHIEVIKKLLEDPRINPSANNNEAIRWVSKNGREDIVNRLLDDPRVDPSANNNEALRVASKRINYSKYLFIVYKLLKDPRVDPSVNNNEVLYVILERGFTGIGKLILKDPRVDPSANNNEALRVASKNGYDDIVDKLLKDPRVDPSANNNEAIHWASKNGHVEIVNILMKDPRVNRSKI